MSQENYGFATRQIHVGKIKDPSGALATPIFPTATFAFDTAQQGGARFAGEEPGYIYTRLANPSLLQAEQKIADLEGAEACLATASGMGAVSATFWSLLQAGDQVIADETLYGCSFTLLTHGLAKFGVDIVLVDMSNPEAILPHLSEKTKVVYLETPCNPNLKIVDIEAVATLTHNYNKDIQVVVDNTFATPYLQRPIALGADIVVHSATKYLNGHSDVIAGFIVGTREFIEVVRGTGLKDMTGAILSPFDAFLVCRGLKTLDIRMDRHCKNCREVAEFLRDHPAVKTIYYPGFEDFGGHEVAKKQMSNFGGMVSVDLNADKEGTANVLNQLKLCTIAVSLGCAETLVEHAASMTHSTYTAEELAASHISPGLVRISVGLEDPKDVIADLKQALDTLL